jgi:hypothetical protein
MKTKRIAVGVVVAVAVMAALPPLAAAQHRRHRRDGESAPTAPFTVETIGAAKRAELVRTGQVTVPVIFAGPGTVLATGDTAVGTATTTATGTGPEGETQTFQVPSEFAPAIRPTSVTASAAGTEGLTLTLTPSARSELAEGRKLELLLSLEPFGGATETVPGLAMFVELQGS